MINIQVKTENIKPSTGIEGGLLDSRKLFMANKRNSVGVVNNGPIGHTMT